MTIPQLKAFDCIDHDPIDEWTPSSEADVLYSLCLHIGLPHERGADLFYVEVVTPEAIREHNLEKQIDERRIVVSPYSWAAVLESIRMTLERCAGESWSQQSALLAKRFKWEFEDYRPRA